MPKTILKRFVGVVLLIATQACAPPVPATPDLNSINTIVAQTMAVLSQTSQPELPVTGDETPTLTASPEAPTPTQSSLATMTAMPLFTPTAVTVTPATASTPSGVQINVSVPTNCRTGPGAAYERVGGLEVGDVAEVVGRHADRNYWVIRNPDRTGQTCWLWGEYASVTGNSGGLPVLTPPPSPTPSLTPTAAPGFDASYSRLESCTGTGWWVDIELENTGGISYQSIAMTVRDMTTNAVLSLYSDDFTNRDGCNETSTRDNLPAGDELLVSSPFFSADPGGHEIRVTVTLCSNAGQSGMCATETTTFTP